MNTCVHIAYSLLGEKGQHESYDDSNGIGQSQKAYDPDLAHPAAAYKDTEVAQLPPGISERKLIAKIDMRVVPILSVLYLLAFLDRTNIANAAVFNLAGDLKLTGTQYNTALTIFFVGLLALLHLERSNMVVGSICRIRNPVQHHS